MSLKSLSFIWMTLSDLSLISGWLHCLGGAEWTVSVSPVVKISQEISGQCSNEPTPLLVLLCMAAPAEETNVNDCLKSRPKNNLV
ncbi:hypothetical protein GCM10007173_31920 [Glutamicibacter ardleyensis]|uniref:Secreted protein n=1 Tax=Glutamicibacter ardleyensis TaxID=225894 RepID=A0ABQ2DUM7_9MICC|nr:hypothetical protein GCM10007173_31920 [Glutamicibacter ardleyensis]